jgi:hypothetical protein
MMRRAILIAVTLALLGCDYFSQFPEETWRQSISECTEKAIEKNNDPDYIIACMAAADFEPLNEDEAPDICFSQHVYDTPGCWIQR